MPHCSDFPDLIELRGADDAVTGLFSDCGAWFGLTWGERGLFELRTYWDDRAYWIDLGPPARARTVWPDSLQLQLANGAAVRAGFASASALVLEYEHARPPAASMELPFSVVRTGSERWLIVVAPEGGGVRDPDCFARNRARWDRWLARAFAGGSAAADPHAARAVARAVTTLGWNHKAPRGDLPQAGVIPSPFGYRGYWGWDSWKHAHALARIDPEWALSQLQAMFAHQRRDGMLPDTAMALASADNWRNSKPPMAAWALEAAAAGGATAETLRALWRCNGAFLRWWERDRRRPGEPFLRCGGVDRETAMWDSGWDDSARFSGAELEPGAPWRLFDLWSPDLNSYYLVECQAMARLATTLGEPAEPWQARADSLRRELSARLWSDSAAWFVDRRPSDGCESRVRSAAGWLPVWAGAASPEQADRVRGTLLDPAHFATPLPFPALARSAPGFDPDGYWNGAVWLDHAALALQVLGEAGAEPAAALWRALAGGPALYECYSPLRAAPCAGRRPAVPQFSWTAAAILELAAGGPRPGPG